MSKVQGVLFHNTKDGKRGFNEDGDEKEDCKYEGEIENGLPNGQGKYTFPERTQNYVGGFIDGLRSGVGTFTWSNGGMYEGKYENNRRNGKGKRTLPSGGIQEGEFKNNEFWSGTIKDKDGNIISNYVNGEEQD
jgi:hypothetical protein|tara:strand:+ start:127 stop:528 length:402 start_codon:yes stop_codon:yes gene_type:complete